MSIELVFIIITAAIVGNIYTDGKYYKMALAAKKYYQMAAAVFVSYTLYWIIKRDPTRAKEIVKSTNECLKNMPVAKKTVSPFLDFGAAQLGGTNEERRQEQREERVMKSGKTGTKRSVSETKKKFVASNQGWKCGDCSTALNAWFEVDHKIRLEHGGSNHVDNLVALCRECHGKKTAMENM